MQSSFFVKYGLVENMVLKIKSMEQDNQQGSSGKEKIRHVHLLKKLKHIDIQKK